MDEEAMTGEQGKKLARWREAYPEREFIGANAWGIWYNLRSGTTRLVRWSDVELDIQLADETWHPERDLGDIVKGEAEA